MIFCCFGNPHASFELARFFASTRCILDGFFFVVGWNCRLLKVGEHKKSCNINQEMSIGIFGMQS